MEELQLPPVVAEPTAVFTRWAVSGG